MEYVALLRGINVGGKAAVPMVRLKRTFEAAGCLNVETYINSGNVLFSDKRSPVDLTTVLEAEIHKDFGLQVPVLIRSRENIAGLCQSIPPEWTNDQLRKTDVMFLWEDIDDPGIVDKVAYNPEIEHVLYTHHALVWSIGRSDVTRGGAIKLIKTDVYKNMTIRNINTLRKLNELFAKREH